MDQMTIAYLSLGVLSAAGMFLWWEPEQRGEPAMIFFCLLAGLVWPLTVLWVVAEVTEDPIFVLFLAFGAMALVVIGVVEAAAWTR